MTSYYRLDKGGKTTYYAVWPTSNDLACIAENEECRGQILMVNGKDDNWRLSFCAFHAIMQDGVTPVTKEEFLA